LVAMISFTVGIIAPSRVKTSSSLEPNLAMKLSRAGAACAVKRNKGRVVYRTRTYITYIAPSSHPT